MKRLLSVVGVLVLMFVSLNQSQGALILVTSRAGLGGTDFVDWGTAGGAFTNLANPFNITSNLGDTITVSQSEPGPFQRRDQGNGWAGNFANGDRLLWTQSINNNNNPVSLFSFDGAGIAAGGAQIQADFFGAFVARIEAFDANNVSLGFFTVNGNSNSAGDNSAIFIGVRSTTTPIARLAFSLDSAALNRADFAINQFDFEAAAVPEPASLALFGVVGCTLAGYFGWRRNNKASQG